MGSNSCLHVEDMYLISLSLIQTSEFPEELESFLFGHKYEVKKLDSSIFKADWGNQDDIDLPNGDLVAAQKRWKLV